MMNARGRSGMRYKANLEKLASGDLAQVVEVVRDPAGREVSCGLSAGEKRMLTKARLRHLVGNRPDRNQSIISSGPCAIVTIQVLC
jgi:RNA polymerase-interacting CarD/CdnL/TRCF family regulator